MNKIEFKKEDVIGLYACGFDSILYYYKNKDTLFKEFREVSLTGEKISSETLDNKRKKIELLDQSQANIELLDLVYKDDKFIGYTMKLYDYDRISCFENRKDKIQILKLMKNKIEELNAQGIYVGNFIETNILLSPDKKDIKITESDNFKVEDLDFDRMNDYMRRYITKGANKEYIDSYCFNMFTLAYYQKMAFGFIDVHDLELPSKFRTYDNEEILYSMKHLNKQYKKKYLIDHIK